MNIEELKRLGEDATPGPWEVRAGVLRKIGEQQQIATIYRPSNAPHNRQADGGTPLDCLS